MSQSTSSKVSRVAIIGSGFGGIGMAIKLKQAGIDDFVILEKEDKVGGTWRDNTYPGAACDVESHLYSFSFEPKHDWTRKYAPQAEIHAYMEACVDKYAIRKHIRFNAEVSEARYDEANKRWSIELTDGSCFESNALVAACGQLNRPATPKIEGLESFKGPAFHSARWDHSVDLKGKKVAVIGTGASAIQFVPELVKTVGKVSLFQRSGAWVIPKSDRDFKAWEKALFAKHDWLRKLIRLGIYWRNEVRAIAFTRFSFLMKPFEWQSLSNLKKHVQDIEKREKLKPNYQIGCKRILISNDWFKAINEPNLDLVTDDILSIEEEGVVTRDGQKHPADAIVFGTGFSSTQFLAPMKITGKNGQDLNEAWRDGASAYKGIQVSGFPNLFMLYGPNTNLGHNSILLMLEAQIHYVIKCLELAGSKGVKGLDVKEGVHTAYDEKVQKALKSSVWDTGCTSWYVDANGRNSNNWPGFTFTYMNQCKQLVQSDYEFV